MEIGGPLLHQVLLLAQPIPCLNKELRESQGYTDGVYNIIYSGYTMEIWRGIWHGNTWDISTKKHNWLVVWNINFIFPYIGGLIIPIDVHIFFRGVAFKPPTRCVTSYHQHIVSSKETTRPLSLGWLNPTAFVGPNLLKPRSFGVPVSYRIYTFSDIFRIHTCSISWWCSCNDLFLMSLGHFVTRQQFNYLHLFYLDHPKNQLVDTEL